MRRKISKPFKIHPAIKVAQYVDGELCQSEGEINLLLSRLILFFLPFQEADNQGGESRREKSDREPLVYLP